MVGEGPVLPAPLRVKTMLRLSEPSTGEVRVVGWAPLLTEAEQAQVAAVAAMQESMMRRSM